MEKIRKSLRDSSTARWTALAIVAFTMLCGYFLTDVMSPLKPMLESQLLWDSNDYGIFTSAYGWFNVFLFMLIIGGIVLDKMGVRFTGVAATSVMIIGAGLKYYAVSSTFPADAFIFGIKMQVALAALGYAIFGVGVEIAGITVSRIIVKWFKGKEMALAMGLEMATARMGTLLATAIPLPIAHYFGDVSKPILFALILLVIGLIAFIVYTFMDRRLDAENAESDAIVDEEPFKLSDILLIVKNKGFWLISILCVLFYSAVFPWIKFATDIVINKYQVDPDIAGLIPSVLPLGTLFLTPFFGNLYDRKGKGATIMVIGSIMLIGIHGIFSIPFLTNWIVALVVTVFLGIALSLVPSAMWPSVPKIIPEKQLGTAYALTFWIQNWGLMGVPLLIGYVLSVTNPSVPPAKEAVKAAVTNTYSVVLENNKSIVLNKVELGKTIEKTTTFLINKILVNSKYEGDVNGNLPAVKMELEAAALKNINSLNLNGVGQEKALEEIQKTFVNSTYSILVDKRINLRYNYNTANVIFTFFGVLAFIVALMLKAEDKKKGYGLELPNIKK
jgi:Nitrate/nitrite transporter